MERCYTCKFWVDGFCDKVGDDREPTLFQIEVKVADDHNLSVRLRTGPDFGCNLHEEREPRPRSDIRTGVSDRTLDELARYFPPPDYKGD